jgi:hypothetical protein
MRHLNKVSIAQAPGLTEFQVAWLKKQIEIMGIPYERLIGTILNEWLSEHPEMLHGRPGDNNLVGRALDAFIRRHGAEFLPVLL